MIATNIYLAFEPYWFDMITVNRQIDHGFYFTTVDHFIFWDSKWAHINDMVIRLMIFGWNFDLKRILAISMEKIVQSNNRTSLFDGCSTNQNVSISDWLNNSVFHSRCDQWTEQYLLTNPYLYCISFRLTSILRSGPMCDFIIRMNLHWTILSTGAHNKPNFLPQWKPYMKLVIFMRKNSK